MYNSPTLKLIISMIRSSIISPFLAISLLLAFLLPACGPSGSDNKSAGLDFDLPAAGDLSSLPQYLQEGAAGYEQLSIHLKDTGTAYIALEAFKWQGLENLVFWEIQAAGAACQTYDRIYSRDEQAGVFSADAKWIALSTMIPSTERVKTIGLSLNYCRDTALKISPRNYYSKVLGSGEADYDKSKKEWLNLCRSLDSSLKSALYLSGTMEKTSNFATVTESFKQASNSTRDRYLSKFQDQSKQFSSLLASLISRLNLAEAAAAKMTGAKENS
ncbi:MAG: hypothetical protein A2Z02_02890 [Chloroflexi bacterium RBG_16_48_7]|nr:MAG: hypothetical protein A2Z02_02890 [Chloroflexi bacterium RBG_16_48_7]